VALNEAARGFANERSDELGLRARRLAEALEAGGSFPEALASSGTRLPPEVLLAVRVGYETSTLSESLRRIARTDADLDLLIRSAFEKGLYLLWIWAVMTGVLTFIMLKIVPVFQRMFFDFDVELPASTKLLIAISELGAQYWFLMVPILLPCLVGSVIGSLYYIDLLPTGAPIVSHLRRRIDAALILRVLALAVRQRWPMNKTIWMLSRVYPSSPVRGRLYAAGTHINNGEDWCPSLRKAGLLRNADVAVLQAASRVGNLEWGLDEMADSSVRRLMYRLRVAISCLFPVTLFLFGLMVAFVVVSLFIPLVALIEGLT
jgi:type II secretory pathway component PulF